MGAYYYYYYYELLVCAGTWHELEGPERYSMADRLFSPQRVRMARRESARRFVDAAQLAHHQTLRSHTDTFDTHISIY